MKISRPKDTTSRVALFFIVRKAIKQFETELRKQPFDQAEYYLEIDGKINIHACTDIIDRYKKAGWSNVLCDVNETRNITFLKLMK